MAIQKELWVNKVQELLFPENIFYRNATNDSAFIEGHAVHIPQAGALSAKRDRGTIPALIGNRADSDLTYIMHEYTSDPILVRDIEETEASYDKLASVTKQMGSTLATQIGTWTIFEWASDINIVKTSGSDRAAYMSTQTGTRKALVFADILNAVGMLNIQNVPMEGRQMVIDGYMYQDLLKMAEFNSAYTLKADILTKGAIGTIAGCEVFVRTPAVVYDSSFAKKAPDAVAAADDNLGLVIYHPNYVRIALGSTKVFGDNDKPEYYGSIVSALVRSGATKASKNDIGVVCISEQA